jgi:hypothetical protein
MSRSRASSSSGSITSTISIPSSAISQPAASTRRRSGDPTRIGLVLLIWVRAATTVRRASRRPLDRHVPHATACLTAGPGAHHSAPRHRRPARRKPDSTQARARSRRWLERKCLTLPQAQRAADPIDLGAGEHHRADRAVAQQAKQHLGGAKSCPPSTCAVFTRGSPRPRKWHTAKWKAPTAIGD